jgi:hypothetical protein
MIEETNTMRVVSDCEHGIVLPHGDGYGLGNEVYADEQVPTVKQQSALGKLGLRTLAAMIETAPATETDL